jgi:hypothetical protein
MPRYTLEEALEEAELSRTPEGCEKLLKKFGLAEQYLVGGAVSPDVLNYVETDKHLLDIADKAQVIDGKELQRVYAEDVRARRKIYKKPYLPSPPDWFEKAVREAHAWEKRPRLCEDRLLHRFNNLRKSSKARRSCSWWFADDVAVLAALILKHKWEQSPDKIQEREIRQEFDGIKFWAEGVVPADSPLLQMTDSNIRVMVDRCRRFGDESMNLAVHWGDTEISLFEAVSGQFYLKHSSEALAFLLYRLLWDTPLSLVERLVYDRENAELDLFDRGIEVPPPGCEWMLDMDVDYDPACLEPGFGVEDPQDQIRIESESRMAKDLRNRPPNAPPFQAILDSYTFSPSSSTLRRIFCWSASRLRSKRPS